MTQEQKNQKQGQQEQEQGLSLSAEAQQRLQQQHSKGNRSSSISFSQQEQAIRKEVSFRGKGASGFYRVYYKGTLTSIISRVGKDNHFRGEFTKAEGSQVEAGVREVSNLINKGQLEEAQKLIASSL